MMPICKTNYTTVQHGDNPVSAMTPGPYPIKTKSHHASIAQFSLYYSKSHVNSLGFRAYSIMLMQQKQWLSVGYLRFADEYCLPSQVGVVPSLLLNLPPLVHTMTELTSH